MDPADTIRRYIEASTSVSQHPTIERIIGRKPALAALDALLAELEQAQGELEAAYRNAEWHEAERQKMADQRQQAQEDLDRTTTAANRIEQQLVEAASVMVRVRAERQQAIDALRDIASRGLDPACPQIARAALAKLGEQP